MKYNENPVTIKEIIEIIAEELNMKIDEFCEEVPGRVGEDSQYWLDSSKIKKELKWEPKISLKQGIKKMIEWVKRYEHDLTQEKDTFILHS